jgi:rubredoxin-NAD+ reductase
MSNAPIVIIGTGLAGYSLAREFRKLDKETPLLLISRDDAVSYSKPMLSTGFAKQKTADELAMADVGKMATQLNASIRNFTEVDRIDTEAKQLTIKNEVVPYSRLVLATGASVNKLKFPGSDLPGVFSINDLADYRAFREALKPNARVLIMGAGLIGCEYANDLLVGGHSITIADPAATALNGLVPEPAGNALVKGLEGAGVTFKFGRFVASLTNNNSDLGGLSATLDDGSVIETDIVISAVGLKPDLSLATSAGLECERGIITNRAMETSAPDVFALGDCAQIDGHVMLYVLPLMASARALAKTLSGERTEVSYGVMPVATKTPACPVVVVPPLANTGEWTFEQDGQNIKGLFKDGDQIHGFVLTGDFASEKQALAKVTSKIHD